MVDAMGGENSEYYLKFKGYCCQAYNWLRKSANLILNLLSLMGDTGIEGISQNTDLGKVLARVEEKFRLDLTGMMIIIFIWLRIMIIYIISYFKQYIDDSFYIVRNISILIMTILYNFVS